LNFTGSAIVTTYTIDSTHANPCAWNKARDPKDEFICGGLDAPLQGMVRQRENDAYAFTWTGFIQKLQSLNFPSDIISKVNDAFLQCQFQQPDGIMSFPRRFGCVDTKIKALSPASTPQLLTTWTAYTTDVVGPYYYSLLDKLNDHPEFGFESSKETKNVVVSATGALTLTVSMEPYASVLFEVAPASVAPVISFLTPASGPIGTSVTLTGTGFTPTGNSITIGSTPNAVINVPSSDTRTLSFSIPSQLCNQLSGSAVCLPLQPGTYPFSVTNTNGTSNTVQFTVTSSFKSSDLNGDGTVNSIDWSIMNGQWNTAGPQADLDNDGIVNFLDWSIMNGRWGTGG